MSIPNSSNLSNSFFFHVNMIGNKKQQILFPRRLKFCIPKLPNFFHSTHETCQYLYIYTAPSNK